MLAIGLMSGTSLDGVDACLVEIKKKKFSIVNFSFYPYDKELKQRILDLSTQSCTIQMVCSMNVELSKIYVKACKKLLKASKIESSEIEFIAMHGQTVWHNPDELDGYESSTLQLGDPSFVAYQLGCKVVSNFRMMDMAAGGCGAPLVPFANHVLFSSNQENIALQNIGGIGNVTYLKKGGKISDIIAFDTGPGNMLIDMAMRRLFLKNYDNGGACAKKGKIDEKVLNELMDDPYLYQKYPKSTGREKYNENFLSEIILKIKGSGGCDYDVISTLAAYTADTICFSINKFLPKIDRLIVSGGGVYNDFIMDRICQKLPYKVEKDENFAGLEALSFAVLGYYTINHQPSNVPNVTGATSEVVLGSVTDPIIRGKLK